jgi:hypothetical protein
MSEEIINRINDKLKIISDYSDDEINRLNIPIYRYQVDLNKLSLDALARFLNVMVPNEEPKNVISIQFKVNGKNENNNLDIIEEINIVSNKKCKLIEKKLWYIIDHLQKNKKRKEKINKENIQELCDKMRESKKKIIRTKIEKNSGLILDNLFDDEKAFNNVGPKRLFNYVMIIQDLIMILLLNNFYDFSKVTENSIRYRYSKENNHDEKFMHCESFLVIKNNILNNYIGVSKLCCPFCQQLLNLFDLKYRGSHNRLARSTRKNWKIDYNEHVALNNMIKFEEWLNSLDNQIKDSNENINLFPPHNLQLDTYDYEFGDEIENREDLDDLEYLKSLLSGVNDYFNDDVLKVIFEKYSSIVL